MGTVAGRTPPASFTACVFNNDGTPPPAHEQSIETASTDINQRRIKEPPQPVSSRATSS
jgi:hypothetical protein